MSIDPNQDFARLHAVSQNAAGNLDPTRQHPLFTRLHSAVLAHKYGQASYGEYLKHPGLRKMDTRDAAIESLQNAGSGVKRYSQVAFGNYPKPFDLSTVAPTTVPSGPSFSYKPTPTMANYSQRMSPPDLPFGTSMP